MVEKIHFDKWRKLKKKCLHSNNDKVHEVSGEEFKNQMNGLFVLKYLFYVSFIFIKIFLFTDV